jgi:hypothetical protein
MVTHQPRHRLRLGGAHAKPRAQFLRDLSAQQVFERSEVMTDPDGRPLALDELPYRRLLAGLDAPPRLVHMGDRRLVLKATLLDEGTYLCSMSTMHRILRANHAAGERRSQATHPARTVPELLATKPGQVWSWDITKLRGPQRGAYYDLYVVLVDNRNGTIRNSNNDVFFYKSTDGGTTWIGPTRVNNDTSTTPANRDCGRNTNSIVRLSRLVR